MDCSLFARLTALPRFVRSILALFPIFFKSISMQYTYAVSTWSIYYMGQLIWNAVQLPPADEHAGAGFHGLFPPIDHVALFFRQGS
jgi:hypothetical protein